MSTARKPCRLALIGLILGLPARPGPARADEPPSRGGSITFTVQAGKHDRRDSVVTFPVAADRLGAAALAAPADRPVALAVSDPAAPPGSTPTVAQASREADGLIRVAWILPRPLRAGESARFVLDGAAPAPNPPAPWSMVRPGPRGSPMFFNRGAKVFAYNATPVTPPRPGLGEVYSRDAYIHPAFSPAGALVTGDFSPFHPHHRGIFLAYVHTQWGDLEPDFWNIQGGTGRIEADGLESIRFGPVTAGFVARHRWEARRKREDGATDDQTALRERWEVELFDVPGSPYWLVDLTATQRAEAHPLELLPYRYGGMAYRSAEPSVTGPIDVLTAEGRHRLDGDQRPTRWVDLTGPVAEGSPKYAGVMIADHPANPGHPTVARIHPITLPFFSFVPAHARPLMIATDRTTVFRYRVVIHDGRPDPAMNDRIAADFAEPVAVRLD